MQSNVRGVAATACYFVRQQVAAKTRIRLDEKKSTLPLATGNVSTVTRLINHIDGPLDVFIFLDSYFMWSPIRILNFQVQAI